MKHLGSGKDWYRSRAGIDRIGRPICFQLSAQHKCLGDASLRRYSNRHGPNREDLELGICGAGNKAEQQGSGQEKQFEAHSHLPMRHSRPGQWCRALQRSLREVMKPRLFSRGDSYHPSRIGCCIRREARRIRLHEGRCESERSTGRVLVSRCLAAIDQFAVAQGIGGEDALHRVPEHLRVVAVVEAPLHLIEVAVEVLGAHLVERSHDRALEQRPQGVVRLPHSTIPLPSHRESAVAAPVRWMGVEDPVQPQTARRPALAAR